MSKQRNKLNKLTFPKIKNICSSKDTIRKVKRQLTEWKKILVNHISDKGLVYTHNKMSNPSLKKQGIELNKHFSKDDVIIWKTQIKTKMKCYFPPTRIATIKR